ncbi:hypothetical protein C8J56DRAFT_896098 [Mycena floridula]|nr:hypothetical protein C8J56DRAFT_896098 [Mycena floridula]
MSQRILPLQQRINPVEFSTFVDPFLVADEITVAFRVTDVSYQFNGKPQLRPGNSYLSRISVPLGEGAHDAKELELRDERNREAIEETKRLSREERIAAGGPGFGAHVVQALAFYELHKKSRSTSEAPWRPAFARQGDSARPKPHDRRVKLTFDPLHEAPCDFAVTASYIPEHESSATIYGVYAGGMPSASAEDDIRCIPKYSALNKCISRHHYVWARNAEKPLSSRATLTATEESAHPMQQTYTQSVIGFPLATRPFPMSEVLSLQTDPFPPNSGVDTMSLRGDNIRPVKLVEDCTEGSILNGVGGFGGFWKFINGTFLFFGVNSCISLLRRNLAEQWHKDFPALHTEGGLPGSESAGIIAFIRECLVDLEEKEIISDKEYIEAQNSSSGIVYHPVTTQETGGHRVGDIHALSAQPKAQ